MHKTIEVLMNEHRLIERALGSLSAYAAQVYAGRPVERPVIAEYARFFRGFTDGCHHGKEEDILFQVLQRHGMPREKGPLAVMYTEHDICRDHVRTLVALGASAEPVAHSDGRALVSCAAEYSALLTQHVLKEDRVLYPIALDLLAPSELDAMETRFEDFERACRKDGTYDALQRLVEGLIARFQPEGQPAVAR